MLQITQQMRILVAVDPVDFRCGIDGLARKCRDALQDPFSGTLFVFCNRRRTSIRVLMYDSQGFWLCTKRLSSGKFRWWPTGKNEKLTTMQAYELQVLLFAGDPSSISVAEPWRKISKAA